MKREITPEENKKLFAFCHSHYVYHYDLQIELVDHMASSIEEQWKENPELSFNEALNKTFEKFGVYGFSKIKTQKKRELKRGYNRLLWSFFTEFYRWPKILMTLLSTFALFILFQLVENSLLIFYAYLLAVILFAVIYFFSWRHQFKIKTRKKFMLIDYLHGILSTFLILIFQIPNLIFQLVFNLNNNTIQIANPYILLATSFILVACGVLIYGQCIYIPQKIKDHFFDQYSEFAL